MKRIALLASLLSLCIIGCRKESDRAIMRINSYTETCIGERAGATCLLVQFDEHLDSDVWSYFNEPIEGFQYQQGYIYRLRVRKETIQDPPMDASSIRYILLDVLSKQKADK